MRCRLCNQEAELVEGHVIPAFVARWIKDTSATGYLRTFHDPNRRVQDFPTRQLLCSTCENRFSAAETKFARGLFYPFHEGRTNFPYESWLLYFAVSLAWRCSVCSDENRLATYPQHVEAVELARSNWAAYLLGQSGSVAPYRFNLFFTPKGLKANFKVPEGIATYFLRAPDGTPIYNDKETAIYVKLPGMIFWVPYRTTGPGRVAENENQ
jgi:hypothetical protein